jgi:soluble lytic murein transglycosylase-like protein
MLDEISNITSRISEIQGRIASLSSQTPAAPPASATPSFAQTLNTAQNPLPAGPSGVAVPPASLGPLPTMPISPEATNVVPLPQISSANVETLIDKYAAQNGLPPTLVRAVIKTESDGNPRCVSKAGAMGLMQLMPANVQEAGISDPFDPEQNIAAGTKQLASLMSQYHGDLDLALAGYNAGPGNVHKYGGVPPFTETQNYIRRVRAAMETN